MQKQIEIKIEKSKFRSSSNVNFHLGINGNSLVGDVNFTIKQGEVPTITKDEYFTYLTFKDSSLSIYGKTITLIVKKKECVINFPSKLQAIEFLDDILDIEILPKVLFEAYRDYFSKVVDMLNEVDKVENSESIINRTIKENFVLPKLPSVSPTTQQIEQYTKELKKIEVFTDLLDSELLGGDFNKLKRQTQYLLTHMVKTKFANEFAESDKLLMDYITEEISDCGADKFIDADKVFNQYRGRIFNENVKQTIYETIFSKLEDVRQYTF